MEGKVTITKDINFNEIIIGDSNLSEILYQIHKRTLRCLQDISIERQKENPDFTDIDAPLHGVLNLIEKIQSF